MRRYSARVASVCLACVLCHRSARFALSQAADGQQNAQETDRANQQLSPIASLELTPEQVSHLSQAVAAHQYIDAEKLLLAELDRDAHSPRAARILAYIGTIYFLNHDYGNAAIAWKKSDAIHKLDPQLQFSLAMAYIGIGHPVWARGVLTSLAGENPNVALYPYWLGRLDYDAQHYADAMTNFNKAITLQPGMARAYDNLGLCFYQQNDLPAAIENYRKAIALDKASEHPSAWPYLNLGIALQAANQLSESESSLRESIRIDPRIAQAHFRLGNVLEDQGRNQEAIAALKDATAVDTNYAEPHLALARVYRKTGSAEAARQEAETYQRLHAVPSTAGAQTEQ